MRTLALLLVILISVTTVAAVLAQDINVGEQMLTDRGIAYGIANDLAGKLYITDWKMGEVWKVDATTGGYTLFRGLGSTLDARPDAAGDIWLTSYWNPNLNRINTSTNPVSMTTWDLSNWDSSRTYNLSGMAFDDLGRAWFSEWGEVSDEQLLYRFDPNTEQLCGYTLPGGNHSWYILYQDPYLWLGDWVQGLVLRFNTTTLEVTYWSAGARSEPRGLALDDTGKIWWADVFNGKLARLDPVTNLLITYTLPDAGSPNYGVPYSVAVHGNKIFYSAQGDEVGTFGMLDPSLASGSSSTAKRYTFTATETCHPLLEGSTTAISTTTGNWTTTWPSRVWTDVSPVGMPGWMMYESPGAEMPYGISVSAGQLWITDQMYNKLIRVAIPTPAPTQTPSRTSTSTSTQTPTKTATQTVSPTSTKTPTPTPTFTVTQTPLPTATKTATRTPTRTTTNTPIPTATKTATKTSTHTATQLLSPTLTKTHTRTSTPIATQTPSPTATKTATRTPTRTATRTGTSTPSSTATKTATKTSTYSSTQTQSPTLTKTPTPKLTFTVTQTPSPTATKTATRTATRTITNTPIPTATRTATKTSTHSPTQTLSPSSTITRTQTSTPKVTQTPSPIATKTATQTVTHTPSQTSSPTMIYTPADKKFDYHIFFPIIIINLSW